MPEWRFRRMGRDEQGIDPVQEEFFATEELGDLNEALVREAIQNSLDAHDGNDETRTVAERGNIASIACLSVEV